jgi:hypothetical protein
LLSARVATERHGQHPDIEGHFGSRAIAHMLHRVGVLDADCVGDDFSVRRVCSRAAAGALRPAPHHRMQSPAALCLQSMRCGAHRPWTWRLARTTAASARTTLTIRWRSLLPSRAVRLAGSQPAAMSHGCRVRAQAKWTARCWRRAQLSGGPAALSAPSPSPNRRPARPRRAKRPLVEKMKELLVCSCLARDVGGSERAAVGQESRPTAPPAAPEAAPPSSPQGSIPPAPPVPEPPPPPPPPPPSNIPPPPPSSEFAAKYMKMPDWMGSDTGAYAFDLNRIPPVPPGVDWKMPALGVTIPPPLVQRVNVDGDFYLLPAEKRNVPARGRAGRRRLKSVIVMEDCASAPQTGLKVRPQPVQQLPALGTQRMSELPLPDVVGCSGCYRN